MSLCRVLAFKVPILNLFTLFLTKGHKCCLPPNNNDNITQSKGVFGLCAAFTCRVQAGGGTPHTVLKHELDVAPLLLPLFPLWFGLMALFISLPECLCPTEPYTLGCQGKALANEWVWRNSTAECVDCHPGLNLCPSWSHTIPEQDYSPPASWAQSDALPGKYCTRGNHA